MNATTMDEHRNRRRFTDLLSHSSVSSKSANTKKKQKLREYALCDLPTTILIQIWIYVPWDIPKLNHFLRQMEPSKEMQRFYIACFLGLAKIVNVKLCNIDSYYAKIADELNMLITAPLLPCVTAEFKGYEKFMNQLSNRSATYLCILGVTEDQIKPSTFIGILPPDAISAIYCLFALATSFCGICLSEVTLNSEISDQQHHVFASAILRENTTCFVLKNCAIKREVVNIWCRKEMLWEQIHFRGDTLNGEDLSYILCQPTLRRLYFGCKLENDCAPLLAQWLQNVHDSCTLECYHNKFQAIAKDQLLQAYRSRKYPTCLHKKKTQHFFFQKKTILHFFMGATESSTLTEQHVVQNLDLTKYMGRWYEIGHLPFKWEDNTNASCVSAIADYELDPEVKDKMYVTNSCLNTNREVTFSRKGYAVLNGGKTGQSAKFTLVFDDGLPSDGSSEYWVLATNYKTYALVGSDNKNVLWILSRTPSMSQCLYKKIKQYLIDCGYNMSRFKTNLDSLTSCV